MFGRRGETDMAVNGVARSERSGLSGQVRVGEFRLDPDDSDVRIQGSGRDRHARQQPASTERHDQCVEVGDLFVKLQLGRPLSGDDPVVVIG